MYTCSICKKEVLEKSGTYTACCEGGKVFADVSGTVYGRGGVIEKETNHNLSDVSTHIVKNFLFSLAAIEFFQHNKRQIYARDIHIKDDKTGREFVFTLEGKSCNTL